ncbi:MAG TPA: hypothetical protein VD763_02390 [Candidatus Saccharimonadales bacterium]|nr:hypothetical protein [Candidatus Saccharimonadales bacterium]
MSERGDDLRTTAEELASDAGRLKAIEETKADLPEDDARIATLSEEAVDLTEEMARKAKVQLALAPESERD